MDENIKEIDNAISKLEKVIIHYPIAPTPTELISDALASLRIARTFIQVDLAKLQERLKKNGSYRAWWDEYQLCKGINKNGTRCQRYCRHPYERQPGDLAIPHMCFIHTDQESEYVATTAAATNTNRE